MQKNETFSFSKERAFHLIPSIVIFFSLSCFTKANRKKCLKIYSFTLRFVGSCLKGNKLEEIVFDHQNCKCIVNCFLSNYNKDNLSFSFRNRNPLRTKNLPTSIFESYNFKRSTSVKGNLWNFRKSWKNTDPGFSNSAFFYRTTRASSCPTSYSNMAAQIFYDSQFWSLLPALPRPDLDFP